MDILSVGDAEDEAVLDRVFLFGLLQQSLTPREHAVLALRYSGYTRSSIVDLLGLGKTTVYTCERTALSKMRTAFTQSMERD